MKIMDILSLITLIAPFIVIYWLIHSAKIKHTKVSWYDILWVVLLMVPWSALIITIVTHDLKG